MLPWRLTWSLREALDLSNYSKHRKALKSFSRFWLALLLKFIPGLWKAPIRLILRDGSIINVYEFMTLYVYKEIFVDGCYDEPKLPDAQPRIIDVGANTGLFTIRIKQLYPNALVHCYEPMPGNFEQLRANLQANSLRDCVLFSEGVGATGRAERLFIHKRNIGGHSIYAKVANSGESQEIHLTGISEAINRLQGKSCSLLKLDCEGAEYEIIKAIDRVLAAQIERLIFESTPALYDINELKDHLDQIGYEVSWNAGIFIAIRRDLIDAGTTQPSKSSHRATAEAA